LLLMGMISWNWIRQEVMERKIGVTVVLYTYVEVVNGKAVVPLQAWTGHLGLQQVEASRISRQSACKGGMVFRPMHLPSLPPVRNL
jgi:hypothetical protein